MFNFRMTKINLKFLKSLHFYKFYLKPLAAAFVFFERHIIGMFGVNLTGKVDFESLVGVFRPFNFDILSSIFTRVCTYLFNPTVFYRNLAVAYSEYDRVKTPFLNKLQVSKI